MSVTFTDVVTPPPTLSGGGRAPAGIAAHLRAVAWVLVIAVMLIAPAYLFTRLTLSPMADTSRIDAQVNVVGRAPDPQLMARLRAAPSDPTYPPAVITYHDIANDGSLYSVTPQAFADQMRLLHDSGWHTLSADEFIGWLHGASLRPHSVLITFDDGASGVWRYVDPVFARYGMRGVAFIITGFVGTHQPYYMTWPELARMGRNGHWDLGAHTYLGHVQVAADASGTRQPFLSTTEWLPAQHRQETSAEFSTRVRTDLSRCVDDLVAHGAPRPRLFAFPFSAVGENALGARLHGIVNDMFDAAFLDSPAGRPTTQTDTARREFRRVDMLVSTTQSGFVTDVEDSLQHRVTTITAQSWRRQLWLSTTAEAVRIPPSGPVSLTTATTRDQWGEMQLDPDHTSFWRGYRARVVLAGLDEDVAGSAHALLHSPDQVQVVVGRSSWLVYQENPAGTRVMGRGTLSHPSSSHTVDLTVTRGKVGVAIDGTHLATLRSAPNSRGGIAVAGDPLRQRKPPLLASVSVTPVPGTL